VPARAGSQFNWWAGAGGENYRIDTFVISLDGIDFHVGICVISKKKINEKIK